LKLCLYKEIYDAAGNYQEPQVINEWKMTPILDATEQVVRTNLDDIQQISSTGLLNWTLQFFVTEIEKSLLFSRLA